MDDKTRLGALAEAKVIAHFLEQGFEVYTSVTGKSEVDLIICKDRILTKVSVKCATQIKGKAVTVQLQSVRSNKTENRIKKFDSRSCDLLAVYILPIDEVRIFDAKNIASSYSINIQLVKG